MRILLAFILGIIVATAGQLLAQNTGIVTDEHGRIYQYGTMPGGATNYWGPNGERGTLYQELGREHKPC